MDSLRTYNGKPLDAPAANTGIVSPAVVDAAKAAAASSAAKESTHKPECGNVGITGELGDLGTNAA